ncbi:MAG: C45 family autoproteolytic acyltransferase/hydrolase [Omnitrophica WOR_2 bacterium]
MNSKQKILASAHRETIDGLLVLHLAGKPYEMGFQHGALCKEEIRSFRREAYRYMATLVASVFRIPLYFARVITRPLLLRQVRAYLPFTPREYLEEMQGVARGANVGLLEALLVNAVWEMYLAGGCSEFAVSGAKSGDGELLHGYNYDLADPAHAFINPYLALIFSRPSNGYAFAQINTVGCVGVNAGLSARGISVAWDNTHLRPGSTLLAGIPRHCTPFELALRRLLQYAGSAEAGVEIVRSHLPRPMADIIIIGDGLARRAVAMEMAGNTSAVREMQEEAVWSANSFVSPAIGPEDKRGMPGDDLEETGSRLGRYASYTELISRDARRIDVPRAVDILRDPYPREKCGYIYPPARPRTICRPVTSFSLVMQPGSGRFWVGDTRIPAPLGRYLGFDLSTESPLAEAPFPATGFHAARQACEHFSAGRYAEAMDELAKTRSLDGPGVPLELMLARVCAAMGQEENARVHREQARELARSGANPPQAGARVPFPSAIQPLIYLDL